MQRYEVEAIFEQKKDGLFEDINISSQKPIGKPDGRSPLSWCFRLWWWE